MGYNEDLAKANTRNCECCNGNYATGRFYGDKWCEFPSPKDETKGLCEFCNPRMTKENGEEHWYDPERKCHNNKE